MGNLLASVRKATGVSVTQAFTSETIMTYGVLSTIGFMTLNKGPHQTFAPFVISASVFLAHVVTLGVSGGSIAPNRMFGVDLYNRDFPDYAWLYYVSPYTASLMAALTVIGSRYIQEKADASSRITEIEEEPISTAPGIIKRTHGRKVTPFPSAIRQMVANDTGDV